MKSNFSSYSAHFCLKILVLLLYICLVVNISCLFFFYFFLSIFPDLCLVIYSCQFILFIRSFYLLSIYSVYYYKEQSIFVLLNYSGYLSCLFYRLFNCLFFKCFFSANLSGLHIYFLFFLSFSLFVFSIDLPSIRSLVSDFRFSFPKMYRVLFNVQYLIHRVKGV